MKRFYSGKNWAAISLVLTMLITPLVSLAQTRIEVPKNKYKIQEDLNIGRKYSAQIDQQMPILNDSEVTSYIQSVGNRLEAAIPAQYRQPQFNCTFKVVNARDINAFALPACYLYVNRGMIEAARNEGEMAGVMAHEISHAMLRHSTAQATRQNNPLNQILGIGAILGGAILGGQTGAALGQTLYSGLFVYPYSREYETQSDILGAQILANAGYDPRDLANMFRTIEQESGGSGPEWLSTHPNPGNRYENINREAGMLRVSSNPIKITRGFERTKAKLRAMPRARSMKEIEEDYKRNGGGGNQNPTSSGRYETRVALPSSRMRTHTPANWLQISVPDNWQSFPSNTEVWYAPVGAYGDQGITRGALIGTYKSQNRDLGSATEEYVNGILQSNEYLRQSGGYTRTAISNRTAYATQLAGRSPVTGETEIATVYTTTLSDGQLFYVVTVVPQREASSYNYAFRNMLRSIRIADR